MLNENELKELLREFDADGLAKVKQNIDNRIYNDKKLSHAQRFVRDEEAKLEANHRRDILDVAKEANEIAKQANAVSNNANMISRRSLWCSAGSVIVAIASALIAIYK